MKTTNKLIGLIALAIITIAMAFTACDNGNGKNDPPTFTVTFHANGGTPEPPPQTIAQGGKAAEPQVTKPNNTLDGWYTQAAFTAQWNFAADTVTADIDLYAKWNCNCPNGTLHLVGETCCDGTGCTCEKNIAGQKVEGIVVTNRQNVSASEFTNMIGAIEEALEWIVDYSAPGQLALIKANIKEIKVVPGPADVPTINQGVLTVKIGVNSNDIWNVLDGFTVAMLKQMNAPIRLGHANVPNLWFTNRRFAYTALVTGTGIA